MSTKKSTKKPAKKSAVKNTKTTKNNKCAKCAKPNKAAGLFLTIFFGVAGLVVVALLITWACLGFNK